MPGLSSQAMGTSPLGTVAPARAALGAECRVLAVAWVEPGVVREPSEQLVLDVVDEGLEVLLGAERVADTRHPGLPRFVRSADREVDFHDVRSTGHAGWMNSPELATQQTLLTNLYAAFNERDIPTLLAAMTPDVSWPNGWEGGLVHGRDQVSAYWRRQWNQLEPIVMPTAFATEADGRIAVTVHQVVYDKTGGKVADHTVTHVYGFNDGLVAEMEIRE